MKKLVLILFVLFSIGVNAQTESHLEFKGIPITGTLDNMINKLKAQGYKYIKTLEDMAVLEGKFVNEDCLILISTTLKSKIVYQITIVFDGEESWWSLKSYYNKLKEQISTKYNVKPKSTEMFLDPYYEGDGYEMQALRKDKCYYLSSFDLDNGIISILIMEDHVNLYYVDTYGDNLNEQEENQSSYDDL